MIGRRRKQLLRIYERLLTALGPSHWWPGESPLEVMVGAILTQNTSWSNVEMALARLKQEGALSVPALTRVGEERLAEWIRPAGYYRLKARRLLNFIRFLGERFDGRIEVMADQEMEDLRVQLLEVKGIGPETADSILLYGLGCPTFVIDAYTYRLCTRHGLAPEDADYESLRALFMESLPVDVSLFNEYHALIVRTGKQYCRNRNPRCSQCPLGEELAAN